jgi:hypothetical protein
MKIRKYNIVSVSKDRIKQIHDYNDQLALKSVKSTADEAVNEGLESKLLGKDVGMLTSLTNNRQHYLYSFI